jgi:predicted nucleic acid-binding protein
MPRLDAAARKAGRIKADLESKGLIIGLPDVMIAAIALCRGLAVVTGNVTHFEYVQSVGYRLTIDNWKTP